MSLQTLLVDDDKIVIFLHKTMVVKTGISTQPLVFNDGKQALDFLKAQYSEENAYLILLDINMPIMNGWEFLDAIQELSYANKLYIIMVTSSVDGADKEMAKKYPQVIGYIEKPIDLNKWKSIKEIPVIADFFI